MKEAQAPLNDAEAPPAVVVRELSKQYRLGRAGSGSLYDRAARLISRKQDRVDDGAGTVMALADVSFSVPAGHVLGVLGRNGSGKSTLMKVLARVTAPTNGFAILHGRVAALLQVGTGFHPELTGRDNIALAGAILGMTRAEIVGVEERIVEFAETGRFLDTPVKHYSTGMYMRLAFSVSAHMVAEIMLVDEVLSVGDAAFQKKCQERIRSIVHEGRTVLFVSHSMAAVRTVCDSAIVLEGGTVRFNGSPADAVDFYERQIIKPASQPDRQPEPRPQASDFDGPAEPPVHPPPEGVISRSG